MSKSRSSSAGGSSGSYGAGGTSGAGSANSLGRSVPIDRAVLGVLRSELQARTPGMPMALREKILAAARPAPRERRRAEPSILSLGYTGGLLAAGLAIAVGTAWYLEHRKPDQATPVLRAQAAAPNHWEVAAVEAAPLLEGAWPSESWDAGDARGGQWLSSTGRTLPLPAAAPDAGPAGATLLRISSCSRDRSAAWCVYAVGTARVACLVIADSADRKLFPDRAAWQTDTGLRIYGQRRGSEYIIAVSRDAAAAEAVSGWLVLSIGR